MVSGVLWGSDLSINTVVGRWHKSLILKDAIVCGAYYIMAMKYFYLEFKNVNFILLTYEHFSSENHKHLWMFIPVTY